MQITCPNCNYSKDIDPALLPPELTKATCPKCDTSFALPGREQAVTAATPQSKPESTASITAGPQITCQVCGNIQGPASHCTNCGVAFVATATEVPTQQYAGFWIRVVASLLDGAILFVVQFALGFLLAMAGLAAGAGAGEEVSGLVMLFGYLVSFAYYIIFTGHCGQTPGKMALRIKVIRTDGSDISYGKAAFREVIGKFISGIILCIGYLMVAFDEKKQGLHDRMADTYVIKL